jgi:prepilin-type N-terminal cleavage/methylation domain-containing protein
MDNRGFTLIEIIIVSLVFMVISAGIFGIYFTGTDLWDIARSQADLQAQARLALNSMVKELRNATRTSTQSPSPNISIPAIPNNSSMTFCLPTDSDGNGLITDSNGEIEWGTSSPILYQYDAGQNRLSRFQGGQETIISQFVTGVQFIDITMDSSLFLDELKVILTLTRSTPKQRNLTITTSMIVSLRN